MKRLVTHAQIVSYSLLGLTLAGCESPVAPVAEEAAEVNDQTLSKNDNRVVGSVTGLLASTYSDSDRRLRFNAAIGFAVHADGSASGAGVGINRLEPPLCFPPKGCTAHARAVCASFGADGNEAWTVIEVTKSDWPLGLIAVGDLLGNRVRDNGEGAQAPPDQASGFFFLKFLAPPLNTAEGWCSGQPLVPLVNQTDRGNVQVRAPNG